MVLRHLLVIHFLAHRPILEVWYVAAALFSAIPLHRVPDPTALLLERSHVPQPRDIHVLFDALLVVVVLLDVWLRTMILFLERHSLVDCWRIPSVVMCDLLHLFGAMVHVPTPHDLLDLGVFLVL